MRGQGWLTLVRLLPSLELGASIVLAAAGQILFKLSVAGGPLRLGTLVSPTLILGFAAYGASAVLWIIVLSHMPLNIAYPFVSLNFILVAGAAWIFLGEALSWKQIAGLGLVVLGLAFVTRG